MINLVYIFMFLIELSSTILFSLRSHSTDSIQNFILDFFRKVAGKYRKTNRSRDFIIHVLQLNVPNIFSSTGEPDDDNVPIETRFMEFLRDYIQRNNLRGVIIDRIQEILSLVSEEKQTVFHWMILSVVQQVSIHNYV